MPNGEEQGKLDRRRFLTTGVAVASTLTAGEALADTPPGKGGKEEREMSIEEKLLRTEKAVLERFDYIYKRHEIHVTFDLDTQRYTFADASKAEGADKLLMLEEQLGALEVLIGGLASYPPYFFKKNNIGIISLGKGLKGSDPTGKRTRLSGVALHDSAIFLEKDTSPDQFINTLHHEIIHILLCRTPIEESSWLDIHKPYIEGDPYEKEEDGKTPVHKEFFISLYAGTDVQEDIAEMAPYLIDPLFHALLVRRIAEETNPDVQAVLERKYLMMQSYYGLLSQGTMDNKYWQTILAEGKRILEERVANAKAARNYTYDYFMPSYTSVKTKDAEKDDKDEGK